MPVELPDVDVEEENPSPPRALTWCVLFVLVVTTGCAASILEWPKTESTTAAWFWCRSFVLPALFWCALFGLRLHYYNDECARIAAEREERIASRELAIQYASEPLAVLDFSYVTALGTSGLSGKIAAGESAFCAQTTRRGDTGVRHTGLALNVGPDMLDLHRECFTALLTKLSEVIGRLPADLPLHAYLDVAPPFDKGQLIAAWKTSCEAARIRSVKAEFLQVGEGIMAIDKWLDVSGGPRLERLVLIISVQLYEQPLHGSGEAAVALLLGWAPLVDRRGIKSVAMLHRPVEIDSPSLTDGLSKAVLWGSSDGAEIEDSWTAGLLEDGIANFFRCSTALSLGFVNSLKGTGVHSVDSALGNCGASAEWLNVALASEHASHVGKGQLCITGARVMRVFVVCPSAKCIQGRNAGDFERCA